MKATDKRISQRERFIEAAREAECSEDEASFDEALRRIAKAKPVKVVKSPQRNRG